MDCSSIKVFLSLAMPTRRLTSQSFLVTRRDGQFWKQKYLLVKIFVNRRAHTAIDQSKFFERVWENFCSQKFSQRLPAPPTPSSHSSFSSFPPIFLFFSLYFKALLLHRKFVLRYLRSSFPGLLLRRKRVRGDAGHPSRWILHLAVLRIHDPAKTHGL